MKKISLLGLLVAIGTTTIMFSSCGNNDKDTTPPAISTDNFLPADCDIYYAGDTLTVQFTCTDDTELGNFNIEIHNNFDHHTHGTSAVDCDDDDDHEGDEHHDEGDEHHDEDHHHEDVEGAWVFNQDYTIPVGQKTFSTTIDIPIPEDIAEGDYHFMLRLTDRAGWQTLKAVAIHIID